MEFQLHKLSWQSKYLIHYQIFFLIKVLFFLLQPAFVFCPSILEGKQYCLSIHIIPFFHTNFSCSFSCYKFLSQPILFQVHRFLVLCIFIFISSLFSSLFPFLYNSCSFLWYRLRTHVTGVWCRHTLWKLSRWLMSPKTLFCYLKAN